MNQSVKDLKPTNQGRVSKRANQGRDSKRANRGTELGYIAPSNHKAGSEGTRKCLTRLSGTEETLQGAEFSRSVGVLPPLQRPQGPRSPPVPNCELLK